MASSSKMNWLAQPAFGDSDALLPPEALRHLLEHGDLAGTF
jgi:hypothetical protein